MNIDSNTGEVRIDQTERNSFRRVLRILKTMSHNGSLRAGPCQKDLQVIFDTEVRQPTPRKQAEETEKPEQNEESEAA